MVADLAEQVVELIDWYRRRWLIVVKRCKPPETLPEPLIAGLEQESYGYAYLKQLDQALLPGR